MIERLFKAIAVAFMLAAHSIRFIPREPCPICLGTGKKPSGIIIGGEVIIKPEPCGRCHGNGHDYP